MDCVNGKGSTPSKNRSKQFEEYWDQQKVEAGLQQGILIEVHYLILYFFFFTFLPILYNVEFF